MNIRLIGAKFAWFIFALFVISPRMLMNFLKASLPCLS